MAVFQKRGKWWIDYRFEGRRIRECIGPKQLAKDVLAKRKAEIAERRFFPDRHRPKILFKEMAKLYFEKHSLVNKRSSRTDSFMLKHLDAAFGQKMLHDVTPFLIEEYRANRKVQVSPSTVNREHQLVRHIFTKAIQWGFAKENPAKGIKLFKVENRRLRFLSNEDIEALMQACDNRIKPIVTAALHTGMRRGELFALQWDHIDLERDLIYVLQTKSGKPREIPIDGTLRKIMEALPRNGSQVFDRTNLRKLFDAALRTANIQNFVWHDLRHTFASHLVMAGVDLMTVKELLGHETMEMTLRYSHLSPDHKRIAIEMLNSKWTPLWASHRESGRVLLDTVR